MIEQDLGQIIPDITATATIDNTTGTPECNITVEEIEELGKLINKFKFSFLHLKGEKGDKPQKGVDYYTPQEKEQFTTETKALVTGEGSRQVSLINAETAKVIQQVKEIVAGNTATTNALSLSGKTRAEFEKDTQGLAGGFSGKFPLTQATLNGIYLLPGTGKFYICTKEYSGTNLTAPNGNFEELSVYKNRDRLENLFKKESQIDVEEKVQIDYFYNDELVLMFFKGIKAIDLKKTTLTFNKSFPFQFYRDIIFNDGASDKIYFSYVGTNRFSNKMSFANVKLNPNTNAIIRGQAIIIL